MPEAALLFVHSPLVGPLTWRLVADQLTAVGWRTVVADIAGTMTGPGPYHAKIAAAAAANELEEPLVLIGHSGAGPLLPGIAARIGQPVQALVYVDAGLPWPGKSWFDTAPPELTNHLLRMVDHGRLPPWNEWFPPQAVSELLPDPALRDAFIAELTTLPLEYFREPSPEASWSGPAGYLLLSEVYRDTARAAAAVNVLVREYPSHHLAMLTFPDVVSAVLADLIKDILSQQEGHSPE